LKLRGLKGSGFGTLSARNYDEYLVKQYLEPSATKYLTDLSDSERETYLAKNTFVTWKNGKATFTWADFLTHVGARKKTTPAFDAFDLSAGENNEFGTGTTKARHFTAYSLKNDTTAVTGTRLDSDIPEKLNLTPGRDNCPPGPVATRAGSCSCRPAGHTSGHSAAVRTNPAHPITVVRTVHVRRPAATSSPASLVNIQYPASLMWDSARAPAPIARATSDS
jgi:hypothetical protein